MENIIEISGLNVEANKKTILNGLNLVIYKNKVNTIVGPSGGGKSTLLKCLNRLTEIDRVYRVSGSIKFGGRELSDYDEVALRREIGMVFQRPNPFPMSIYENVAFGLRLQGSVKKEQLDRLVIQALEEAGLYAEVKEDLKVLATTLSGGQQQRLCIARALILRPKILMMDEPTSSLDPVAKGKIEDLIKDLKERYSVILVTHDMNQARRVSDFTSLIYNGKIVASAEGTTFDSAEIEEIRPYLGDLIGEGTEPN